MVRNLLSLVLLFFAFYSHAQKINADYKYNIRKTSSPIKIDGILDDEGWQSAQVAGDFNMMLPMDTSKANIHTEVRMTYNDQFIYICVKNEIPHKTYNVESLRRDWSFGKNDNFLLIMDTYNDLTNGFAFGINAAGAQWDGQQYDGSPVNLSWDNKWYSKVKQYDDHWIFEAAIPFKSIRYNKTLESWGINFGRMDLASTEKSSWTPVPRQFASISSAYTGQLIWDNPPPKAGANVSAIPYLLVGNTKNFEGGGSQNTRREIGGDVKIALGSALNLDLTVNPDFSQVEVDRQQTNLDRFELFFPERRQFFLENDDLFNNLGMSNIRPFFSRRIGLGVPINYGARLSGKLNKNLRIGAMDIKTGQNKTNEVEAQNFTVVTLQQKVFSRSSITGVFINKDEIGSDNFNRNIGLEYNLASHNNLWQGKFMYYHSFGEEDSSEGNGIIAGQMTYNTRHLKVSAQYEKVGKEYEAEVGYIQRNAYSKISPRIEYLFFPKKGKILTHGPSFFNNFYFDNDMSSTEYTSGVTYEAQFRNKGMLRWYYAKDYIKLKNIFDPTNFTGIELPIGSEHYWSSTGVSFTSKPQSLFTYEFGSRIGGYYSDGTRVRLSAEAGYRFQPFVQLAVQAAFNDIKLPENQGLKDARFWLISPRIDVTLTNNLYFTTFVQYNEQIKNTNVNARLQWRYKPVSDIYLVYTDNYATIDPRVKNRAVVLKATYWGNL